MKTAKMKLGELVLDFDIYPRVDVDSQHLAYLREADDAGFQLPPIIVDEKSKRVVDGFHRIRMYRSKYDENFKLDVILKSYKNEAELLLDSIRYNASHGRTLTRYDKTHCILLAGKLHIPDDELASALVLRVEAIGELRADRVGELRVGGGTRSVALKRTIEHMTGRRLTKRQAEANERLSGMAQVFYANQLIILIESGLLNYADERLLEQLAHLRDLLCTLESLKVAEAV